MLSFFIIVSQPIVNWPRLYIIGLDPVSINTELVPDLVSERDEVDVFMQSWTFSFRTIRTFHLDQVCPKEAHTKGEDW